MVDHDHARLAWQSVANGEDQTWGFRGCDMGHVEVSREEWYYAVCRCTILVADSSTQHLIGAAGRGSGRGLGMGSGWDCGRVGAASERAGDDAEGEQHPWKEVKGWARALRISKAVSITIGLAALERTHTTLSLCHSWAPLLPSDWMKWPIAEIFMFPSIWCECENNRWRGHAVTAVTANVSSCKPQAQALKAQAQGLKSPSLTWKKIPFPPLKLKCPRCNNNDNNELVDIWCWWRAREPSRHACRSAQAGGYS